MIESPKRIRTRMLGLYELTRSATTRAPSGATLLHQTIRDLDGYPTSASGADDGAHGTSELTSVEAAAHRRLGDFHPAVVDDRVKYKPGPTLQLERMSHLIGVATAALHEIITIADNVAPPPTAQSRDICVGGNGLEWWTPPTGAPNATACSNVQEKGRATGLCHTCRVKRQRWSD